MPCPLFLPSSPLGDLIQDGMPLGEIYGGECSADAGALIPIDTLRHCCNFGYAAAQCERARRAHADAARYLIKSDREGVVEVAWSVEKNHHPVAVGTLLIGTADAPSSKPDHCEPIDRSEPIDLQARAAAASYLRRTGRQ